MTADAAANANRKVIFSAAISLAVANLSTAAEKVTAIAKEFGGFVVSSTLTDVTFRVPPDKFEAALTRLAGLGDVVTRNITSQDVTQQYRDLNLRLEVAEGSRQRLMELMKKSGETKDVLEVERDIRRLTEEIEQMKGGLRHLQDQIDMSTIQVSLQQKTQVVRRKVGPIFDWLRLVNLEDFDPAGSGGPIGPDGWWESLWFDPEFRLDVEKGNYVPLGFAALMYEESTLYGATPEGYWLRARHFELRQRNDLEFWMKALQREFEVNRGYKVMSVGDAEVAGRGLGGKLIQTASTKNDEPWLYDVWLIQNPNHPKHLYVIEFARGEKAEQATAEKVRAAVKGMRADLGWWD